MEIADTKAGKRKVGGQKSVLNENPAGASLGDGSMLAFRFGPKGNSRAPAKDDVEIEEDPGWNVVLPSYDDDVE